MLAAFDGLRGFAAHDFIKVAFLAARGGLLVEQREPALVKFLEPFVPRNLLQLVRAGVAGEVEPENADVAGVSGAAYATGVRTALLGPAVNFIVVGCNGCLRSRWHVYPPSAVGCEKRGFERFRIVSEGFERNDELTKVRDDECGNPDRVCELPKRNEERPIRGPTIWSPSVNSSYDETNPPYVREADSAERERRFR